MRQKLVANSYSDRLAVVIIMKYPNATGTLLARLQCCIDYINIKLAATPHDIFIWTNLELDNVYENSHVLSLHEDQLHTTSDLYRENVTWTWFWRGSRNRTWMGDESWQLDYRLIGRWRMIYPFHLALELGYKYLLQSDIDVIITDDTLGDAVNTWLERNISIVAFGLGRDIPSVVVGLAELARYWLVSRLSCDLCDKSLPHGPLFEHCGPPNITGLFSPNWDPEALQAVGWNGVGWDGESVSGAIFAFSVDFWFRDDVQDFVDLVLRNGGHIEHRWNEQATNGMIRHLFIPSERMHLLQNATKHKYDIAEFCSSQAILSMKAQLETH